jgi:hypothetical protein
MVQEQALYNQVTRVQLHIYVFPDQAEEEVEPVHPVVVAVPQDLVALV